MRIIEFFESIITAELGQLDRRAKLDFIENFAEPGIVELGPLRAQNPDKPVKLVHGYPPGEQAETDLLQSLEYVLAARPGMAPALSLFPDFLNRQDAVEHTHGARRALRRRFGAGSQFRGESPFRSARRALRTTDRAQIPRSCSRNPHWLGDPESSSIKLHASPLKKP